MSIEAVTAIETALNPVLNGRVSDIDTTRGQDHTFTLYAARKVDEIARQVAWRHGHAEGIGEIERALALDGIQAMITRDPQRLIMMGIMWDAGMVAEMVSYGIQNRRRLVERGVKLPPLPR